MKKLFYSFVLTLIFLVPLFAVNAGLSTSFGPHSNLNIAAQSSGYQTNKSNNITTTFGNIISLLLALVGTIFLALIIYGGITWMMAGGQAQKIERAGDIIRQALIGLIIVVAAYGISYYLINMLKTPLTH